MSDHSFRPSSPVPASGSEADNQRDVAATSGTPAPVGRLAAVRRTFMALADQGVVSGGNVLMSVVIGRVLGSEPLGFYALLFTGLLMASAVLDATLSLSFLTRLPEFDALRRRRYATACLILALICGGVLAVASWSVLWLTDEAQFVGGAGAVAAVLVPAFLLREHMRRYEFAFLRMDAALALDVVSMGVQFVLIGVLLLAADASLSGCLLAMSAGNGVGAMAALVRRRGEFTTSEIRLHDVFRDVIRLSPGVLLAQLLLIAGLQIMPWLVMVQLGTAATGTYAACMTLANIANPALTGFINVMLPAAGAAYSGGPVAVRRAIQRDTTVVVLAMAAIGAVTLVFAGDMLNLMFGSRFADVAPLLRLLAVAFFVRSLDVGATVGCWALRHSDRNIIANLVGTAVAVVVALTLMPSLGLYGAGLGMLVGNTVGVLLRWGMFLHLCATAVSRAS